MSLIEKIIGIYPSMSIDDFVGAQSTVVIRNDGDGPYIARWEHPTLTQPTEQQLAEAEPSLVVAQNRKIAEINDDFAKAASALTDGYPEAERMTWATQQKEVLAWADDPDAPTPYLDGLAAARGITPEEMREKTLQQTQLFMAASQQLVGKRQRLRDLVYEAETPEDLEAIQWDEPAAE